MTSLNVLSLRNPQAVEINYSLHQLNLWQSRQLNYCYFQLFWSTKKNSVTVDSTECPDDFEIFGWRKWFIIYNNEKKINVQLHPYSQQNCKKLPKGWWHINYCLKNYLMVEDFLILRTAFEGNSSWYHVKSKELNKSFCFPISLPISISTYKISANQIQTFEACFLAEAIPCRGLK